MSDKVKAFLFDKDYNFGNLFFSAAIASSLITSQFTLTGVWIVGLILWCLLSSKI